jgi:glutathione S-transferase
VRRYERDDLMLTIWGRGNSLNVKKVLWVAEELGLPFEHIKAGGAFGGLDDGAFRAMNPNGLVPTIDDDGVVLWESNAITRYLAAKYGEGSLWASDPTERAQADKWMDWTSTNLFPKFRDLFWNMARVPEEKRNVEAMEQSLKASGELFAYADAVLAGRPFLSGDRLGIGDIPVGCVAYPWFELPIDRPALPHLAAWYERLKERQAYRKGVMTPLT